MTDLQELRKEIDQIDSQMVALYEKRAKIVEDVARYKIETGKPVLDPQREQALLEKLGEKTHSDFNCRSIREVYQQIMSISRRRQYQLLQEHGKSPDLGFTQAEALNRDHVTVVFQGVEGAYSYAAMNAFFGKAGGKDAQRLQLPQHPGSIPADHVHQPQTAVPAAPGARQIP